MMTWYDFWTFNMVECPWFGQAQALKLVGQVKVYAQKTTWLSLGRKINWIGLGTKTTWLYIGVK